MVRFFVDNGYIIEMNLSVVITVKVNTDASELIVAIVPERTGKG